MYTDSCVGDGDDIGVLATIRSVCWWWYNDWCVGDGTKFGVLVMVLP